MTIKVNTNYIYNPSPFDQLFANVPLKKGDVVKVITHFLGKPAKGNCWVGDLKTGKFIGMVREDSLEPLATSPATL